MNENNKAFLSKFGSDAWTLVGGESLADAVSSISISLALDHEGIPYVCYGSSAYSNAILKKYDGKWQTIGDISSKNTDGTVISIYHRVGCGS